MRASALTEYVAAVDHVREVVLVGSASPAFWRARLRAEGLAPYLVDDRACLLLAATELKFHGFRFRELTVSVLVSRDPAGRSQDGAYLLLAFNSSRLFAFIERRWFHTPYHHARIDLAGGDPFALEVCDGPTLVLDARSNTTGRPPIRTRVEHIEAPVFLPHPGRPRQLFLARIGGFTRTCPFDPARDTFAVHPTAATAELAALVDSGFTPTTWQIRDDAAHARSQTFARGELWPGLAA